MAQKVRCPDCGDVIDARACWVHGSNIHGDAGRTLDDYETLEDGPASRAEGVVVVQDPDIVSAIQDMLAGGGA